MNDGSDNTRRSLYDNKQTMEAIGLGGNFWRKKEKPLWAQYMEVNGARLNEDVSGPNGTNYTSPSTQSGFSIRRYANDTQNEGNFLVHVGEVQSLALEHKEEGPNVDDNRNEQEGMTITLWQRGEWNKLWAYMLPWKRRLSKH